MSPYSIGDSIRYRRTELRDINDQSAHERRLNERLFIYIY